MGNFQKDKFGNVIKGNVLAKNTSNCYLRSEKRLITTIGIEDLIIIETSDAILVASKEESQEVKNIVTSSKKRIYPRRSGS